MRALRKWLSDRRDGLPCDVIYWSSLPRQELTRGQRSMYQGAETILGQIRGELARRGVDFRTF